MFFSNYYWMFSISVQIQKMYYSYKKSVLYHLYRIGFILSSLDSNHTFEGRLSFERVLYFHALNFRWVWATSIFPQNNEPRAKYIQLQKKLYTLFSGEYSECRGSRTLVRVLAFLNFEYSPENKVYSFFWSWVYGKGRRGLLSRLYSINHATLSNTFIQPS